MTTDRATYNEIDAYIAEHTGSEQIEFEAAEIAFDILTMFQHAADEDCSNLSTLINRPMGQVTLEMIGKYLDALGYDLTLVVTDQDSGRSLTLNLPDE